MFCAQVALAVLIGLPICLLVKRSWAIHRVVPSVFADHRAKENVDVASTGSGPEPCAHDILLCISALRQQCSLERANSFTQSVQHLRSCLTNERREHLP